MTIGLWFRGLGFRVDLPWFFACSLRFYYAFFLHVQCTILEICACFFCIPNSNQLSDLSDLLGHGVRRVTAKKDPITPLR